MVYRAIFFINRGFMHKINQLYLLFLLIVSGAASIMGNRPIASGATGALGNRKERGVRREIGKKVSKLPPEIRYTFRTIRYVVKKHGPIYQKLLLSYQRSCDAYCAVPNSNMPEKEAAYRTMVQAMHRARSFKNSMNEQLLLPHEYPLPDNNSNVIATYAYTTALLCNCMQMKRACAAHKEKLLLRNASVKKRVTKKTLSPILLIEEEE
jgi:hypothetical protein